jgi:hypothetical protein
MQFALHINLEAVRELTVTLAHKKIELGKQEKRNLNETGNSLPEFLFS